ncbi:MAG: right-handed parallel beta-helix repeat-containing protein [Marinicella sp.]
MSKVQISNPVGNYGFSGRGGAADPDLNQLMTLIDINGEAYNNTQFEWIRMEPYSVSYHLYDLVLKGGKNGISTYGNGNFPKYIFGTNVTIEDTSSHGIILRQGSNFQLKNFNIIGSKGHGIWVTDLFTGGILLTDILITDSDYHGILIEGGEQIQIFKPLIGYNSQVAANAYSGIYVAKGVNKFNVSYGASGQFDDNRSYNQQKRGIELEGQMGVDHNYFSITEVNTSGNQTVESCVNDSTIACPSDPAGNWFFQVRNDTLPINLNENITLVPSLMEINKEFIDNPDEEPLPGATGGASLQASIDNICNNPQNYLDGGVIWLRPGVYQMTSDLNIDNCSNLKIIGSGRCNNSAIQCSRIYLEDSQANINIKNSQNISLSHFRLFGNNNNNHDTFGIKILNSNNTTISDIYGVRLKSGVSVQLSSDSTFVNNNLIYIKDLGYSLLGDQNSSTERTTVYRTYFGDDKFFDHETGIGEDGTGTLVRIGSYTNDTTIIQAVAVGAKKTIETTNGSGSVPTNIKGYLIGADHNSNVGIHLNGGSNIEFSNVWIAAQDNISTTTSFAKSGIRIDNVNGLTIENAYIRYYGGNGLNIINGSNINVHNSMIGFNGLYSNDSDCTYDGVRLYSGASNVLIKGSTIGELFSAPLINKQKRGVYNGATSGIHIEGSSFIGNCILNQGSIPQTQQYNPGW